MNVNFFYVRFSFSLLFNFINSNRQSLLNSSMFDAYPQLTRPFSLCFSLSSHSSFFFLFLCLISLVLFLASRQIIFWHFDLFIWILHWFVYILVEYVGRNRDTQISNVLLTFSSKVMIVLDKQRKKKELMLSVVQLEMNRKVLFVLAWHFFCLL